jgi:8-oxo-dGTP diphosphatase
MDHTWIPTSHNNHAFRKRAVVAVILRGERLLIIRRALTVTAPGKLCLPGGGIEEGESESEAIVREMQEELSIQIEPVRLCWSSVTPWNTSLAWWLSNLETDVIPVPNPDEVAEVHWMTVDEICNAADMLPSLPAFVKAWRRGEVDLQLPYLKS